MSLERHIKVLLVILILISPVAANGGDCKGHIFFYIFENEDTEVSEDDAGEAEADFIYYYHKIKNLLPDKGISFSIHSELPIKAMTCFGTKEIVEEKELIYSLGFVFVSPNLERRVEGGVMTDVDIDSVIDEFFNKPNS